MQAPGRTADVEVEGPEAAVDGGGVQTQISRHKQEYGKVFYPGDSNAAKVFLVSWP